MHQISSYTFCKIVDDILECPYFHRVLRVLGFGAHVWYQRDVVKFHQSWIDLGLVGEDVKTSSAKLQKQ